MKSVQYLLVMGLACLAAGCAENNDDQVDATVAIKNDFNNPEMAYQPPWTICQSSYLGTEFGTILTGETSKAKRTTLGLGYVLMVAAWNDPDCNAENALPIASKSEEEVADGQTRTIAINMANHQGPCPPEGVEPIPQANYESILKLWPDYAFQPYETRTQNPQCLE